MKGAGTYGALFAVLFTLMYFGPRPAAPAAVGTLWVVLLSVGALLTWRRTGLRLAAASMATGAVAMVVYTRILMRAGDFFAASPAELAALFATMLGGAGLMLAQGRTEPELWARWKAHSDRSTVLDHLLFRHIPDLRGEGPAPHNA